MLRVFLTIIVPLLLAGMLAVVTVHFGQPVAGVYVPPRYQDGRIEPGHVEPKPVR
jgi:hypothetical protein